MIGVEPGEKAPRPRATLAAERLLCVGGTQGGRHVLTPPSGARYWSFPKRPEDAPPRALDDDPEDAMDPGRDFYERHVFYDASQPPVMVTMLAPLGWSGSQVLGELLAHYRP